LNAPPGRTGDCGFCEIVRGEREALIVLEGERTLAFLDNRPLFPGHSLLVPREHYETLADLPDELLPEFFSDARVLAQAMEEGLGADGSFVAINNRVSQSVPHLHVHVVPRRRKDGLRGFFWPRQKYESEAEAEDVRRCVSAVVTALKGAEGVARPAANP
jgi:histidine triad (HIT) family protein